jgi:hypothetical protein
MDFFRGKGANDGSDSSPDKRGPTRSMAPHLFETGLPGAGLVFAAVSLARQWRDGFGARLGQ